MRLRLFLARRKACRRARVRALAPFTPGRVALAVLAGELDVMTSRLLAAIGARTGSAQ